MTLLKQAVVLSLITLPSLASAQDGHLRLPDFRHLAAKASEHTDISLGPLMLHLADMFVQEKDPDAAAAHKVIAGLSEVEIHTYEFDSDNVWSNSDAEAVRQQLVHADWKPLVQSHSATDHEDVDIYVSMNGDQTNGLTIIATEPREFTVVHVVGKIDLKDLAKLGGQMGVSRHVAAVADSESKSAAD